jgi:hypothetical protein
MIMFTFIGLDSNLKMWRFYADILNDLAVSIDLIIPFFKSFLLPISCVSNLCRAIVGVAGGSTRAALTQHQAIAHNMGDVSAKDGSQETLVNLLALVVNLWLLHVIKRDRLFVWFLYFLLTFLHLYANYRAIRTLQLRTWNWNRFVLVCHEYFQFKTVPTIEYINRHEPTLYEIRQPVRCHVGIRLRTNQAQTINIEQFSRDRFSIAFDRQLQCFHVILADTCSDTDLIRCYFLIQYLIHFKAIETYAVDRSSLTYWMDIDRLYDVVASSYEQFLIAAERIGWDVKQAKFLTKNYRYTLKYN